MTVCIAALAEEGTKAVLVADKLITTTGTLPYQVDMVANKIIKINGNVYVMWCGGYADSTAIIENSKNNIGDNKWAGDIAKLINDKHLEYLLGILSRSQLSSRGAKDISEFYKEYYSKLDETTRRSIDQVLTTFVVDSRPQFIVCGKESDGKYKIYLLNVDPRHIPLLVPMNYSTIGSGWTWADFSIIQSKYSKSLTLAQVKTIMIKAKKEAERDQNVGNGQNIEVLE